MDSKVHFKNKQRKLGLTGQNGKTVVSFEHEQDNKYWCCLFAFTTLGGIRKRSWPLLALTFAPLSLSFGVKNLVVGPITPVESVFQ